MAPAPYFSWVSFTLSAMVSRASSQVISIKSPDPSRQRALGEPAAAQSCMYAGSQRYPSSIRFRFSYPAKYSARQEPCDHRERCTSSGSCIDNVDSGMLYPTRSSGSAWASEGASQPSGVVMPTAPARPNAPAATPVVFRKLLRVSPLCELVVPDISPPPKDLVRISPCEMDRESIAANPKRNPIGYPPIRS